MIYEMWRIDSIKNKGHHLLLSAANTLTEYTYLKIIHTNAIAWGIYD